MFQLLTAQLPKSVPYPCLSPALKTEKGQAILILKQAEQVLIMRMYSTKKDNYK